MAGKFPDAVAALRTYAITRRREAEAKRGEASRLLEAVDDLLLEAKEFDAAADVLMGQPLLTDEERKAIDAIVCEFSKKTAGGFKGLFR